MPEQGAEALPPWPQAWCGLAHWALPSVLCGCCPSRGWALVDGYLSCGLGQSQSQDMGGRYSLDGKGKDVLAGSGQGMGFSPHHGLDELPMTTHRPPPWWIWD